MSRCYRLPVRISVSLCLLVCSTLTWAQSIAQPLVVQPVNESRLITLPGNVHPLARQQFDAGAAPATLPLNRMLLVLKRSVGQDTALTKLLDDQQDKSSPMYHKWLTPDTFGQ